MRKYFIIVTHIVKNTFGECERTVNNFTCDNMQSESGIKLFLTRMRKRNYENYRIINIIKLED